MLLGDLARKDQLPYVHTRASELRDVYDRVSNPSQGPPVRIRCCETPRDLRNPKEILVYFFVQSMIAPFSFPSRSMGAVRKAWRDAELESN
jgi:hypothetical protein